MEQLKCEVCGEPAMWRWTDTHGVAQHVPCGAPYRIIHYNETNQRVGKAPELLLKPEWVDRCRQFWKENRRPMPSGGFSFMGDPGYEMASAEDREAFGKFCEQFEVESSNHQ